MSRRRRAVTFGDLPAWRLRADGTRLRADEVSCPCCGAPLAVDEAAEKFYPTQPTRAREAVRVALCGGCDFTPEF